MKKRVIAMVSLALGALLIWFLSSLPGAGVSLTLMKYTRWPHGATLQLTNRTQRTITYVADSVLSLQKTPSGWTNTSLSVKTEMAWSFAPNGLTLLTNKHFFYVSESTGPPKAGDRISTLSTRDLKPGQSIELWVMLEPDALPKRVGTVYVMAPGKPASKLQSWLAQIKRWSRIKSNPRGYLEVWCSTPLSVSSSPESPAQNQ